MKLNRRSIGFIIQKYFILFIIGIMLLLWVFEVILLDPIYREVKIKETENLAHNIYNDVYKSIEDIGLDSNSLILLISSKGTTSIGPSNMEFLSPMFYEYMQNNLEIGQGVLISNKDEEYFINSPDRERIAYLLKVSDTEMIVVNTLLLPPDSMTQTIQYIIIGVTLILLIYSFIISRIINKKISKPIMVLSEDAKRIKDNLSATSFKGEGYQEIEDLTLTLNEMREAIAKVDQLRTELIGNVSHDLKTPLTMIEGYAEMMKDIPEECTEENLDIIIQESKYLTKLVNDLLDMSSLQAGIEEINFESCDLNEIVDEMVHRFKTYYPQREITIDTIDEVIINCDKKLIQQALYNLLDNALQHTSNSVLVEIRNLPHGYRVQVVDYGKGMNTEELDTIWDRYYSTKLDHQRHESSSGLGLSIVRNIFQKHDFKYGVDSELDKGSIFWFEIPK